MFNFSVRWKPFRSIANYWWVELMFFINQGAYLGINFILERLQKHSQLLMDSVHVIDPRFSKHKVRRTARNFRNLSLVRVYGWHHNCLSLLIEGQIFSFVHIGLFVTLIFLYHECWCSQQNLKLQSFDLCMFNLFSFILLDL